MQASASHQRSTAALQGEHRNRASTPLNLFEIERASVVDAIRQDEIAEPDGVYAVGAMRELCPHCQTSHLKLVLRQKRVRRSHLFCDACSRCFDARYLDGTPALEMEY